MMDILFSGEFWIDATFRFVNMGLTAGLMLGFLVLLRPVTTRLLSPRQRVWVWAWVFFGCNLPGTLTWLSYFRILPVTMLDLITPRTAGNGVALPMFLPEYRGAGLYNLAFPGSGSIQVELNDGIGLAIAAVFWIGLVVVLVMQSRGERALRRLSRAGEQLDDDHPLVVYANQDMGCVYERNIDVYLCDRIPTSFVQRGSGKQRGREQIFLQREISEERRELILRHEVNHLRLGHCWVKQISNVLLSLYWWNPVVWLAYFMLSLDLEMDCDERTVKELTQAERREYAHALVELGSGRQLWSAPLSFGECDTQVRVRALVRWKPRKLAQRLISLGLAALLMLFYLGGPSVWQAVELPEDRALETAQTARVS